MSNIKTVDGVELLSLDALALLCGVTPEEATAEYARQREGREAFTFRIPQAWLRGSKEIQAKHGTRDFNELIARIRADRSAS